MKSRGVYETPGGTILRAAHMAMESITMDREVMHLRDSLIPRYAETDLQRVLVFPGNGTAAEHDRSDPAKCLRDGPPGTVQGQLPGSGRKSDQSLYSEDFATFEDDAVYSQKDAEGFIRLNALRLRIQNLMK